MERQIIEKLEKWKSKPKRKPLILKGVRQVGKTFILKKFGKDAFKKYHYFNFEKNQDLHKIFEHDLSPQRIIQELSLFSRNAIQLAQDLIIFDEIQECPKALTSLKYFHEELPEAAICSAGSLLGVELGRGSFPVGKVDMLTLHPMSFQEFLLAHGESQAVSVIRKLKAGDPFPVVLHDKLWHLLKIFFIIGGMPEVVDTYLQYKNDLLNVFEKIREVQASIYEGYLADMAKHSGKVNAMHLERVFKSVPEQLSRTQDGSAPKYKFKGVVPNISQYARLANAFDWLETAGLIHKIPIVNSGELPFSAYTKESFFKLFIFDIGMLGFIAGLSPKTIYDYDYGTYKGFFAENFVLQELLAANRGPLYSWHEGDSSVEFIFEVDGKVIPIEVKAGANVRARSLSVFEKKYNPPFTVKISSKPLMIRDDVKTHNYPLYLAGVVPLKKA